MCFLHDMMLCATPLQPMSIMLVLATYASKYICYHTHIANIFMKMKNVFKEYFQWISLIWRIIWRFARNLPFWLKDSRDAKQPQPNWGKLRPQLEAVVCVCVEAGRSLAIVCV